MGVFQPGTKRRERVPTRPVHEQAEALESFQRMTPSVQPLEHEIARECDDSGAGTAEVVCSGPSVLIEEIECNGG